LLVSSLMLSILLEVVGAGGGVITLPVFPLGLESVFEDALPSLKELATASEPAEELAEPLLSLEDPLLSLEDPLPSLEDPLPSLEDPLPSLEELATASEPAEELAEPLLSLEELDDPLLPPELVLSSFMLSILLEVVGAGGGVITLPVFPLGLESVFEDALPSLEGLLSSSIVSGLS